MYKKFSVLDRLLIGANNALGRIDSPTITLANESPANHITDGALDADQKRHFAGLMRINHTGEICAQALYQGQALVARNASTRTLLLNSAAEEFSHLSWCAERLQQLDAKTSYLNPMFYTASLIMGATVAMLGDKVSLGFIVATEELVGEHLRSHLDQIGEQDPKSYAVLSQMITDEQVHAHKARVAGGWYFPPIIKSLMRNLSKMMLFTTYRI